MKAIMYHYIRPETKDLPFFRYLHVDDFSRQLDFFEQQFGYVTREDLLRACHGGPIPSGVILTFDDGLSDHYDHVFPVLRERGLFGLFYVCTSPYERRKLLEVHRIHLILGRVGGRGALQRLSKLGEEFLLGDCDVHAFREKTYRNQDNDEATRLFKQMLNYLIPYDRGERILDRLFHEEFRDEGPAQESFYLTGDQVREMDAAGMIIGSHGANHYVFSRLSLEEQRHEIATSFATLASILGKPVTTFCYPYGGGHTFTLATPKLLEDAGSKFAFSVEPRDISVEDFQHARQALPRYDCNMFPYGRASLGEQRAQQAA